MQCLYFPVSSSSRAEHEPLPISLNGEGVRVNTAAVSSFWTLPVYKSRVPKRKEQLLDQWRKWKALYINQVPVALIDLLIKAVWNCSKAGIYQCQSCACRPQASPLGSLGWTPKLILWEEWEMLVSSEESSIQLCCKLKWMLLLTWAETLYYPFLLKVLAKIIGTQIVLAKIIGTLTLGF